MTLFDFSTLGGAVASIVAVSLLLGSVFVLVRASYRNAVNEQLRKVNEDLREEASDRKRREEDLKKEVSDLRLRVSNLEAERDYLRAIPNEKFEQVKKAIDDHHVEATTHWLDVQAKFDRIVELLEEDDE
jgi:hypothetical protein